MGCSDCGRKQKTIFPQTVNYVLKNSSNQIIGEFGSRVDAVKTANKLPYETVLYPVKLGPDAVLPEISSTEEKQAVAKKTVKKATKKTKKES